MPTDWANSGLDLHLDVSRTALRASLEKALRAAVQDGRLAPGTRLPPSRSLAHDLGVARNTVADAYGQLVAEGWLAAHQGSGTTVADHPAAPAASLVAPVVESRLALPYDLRAGFPDVSSFPRREWLAASRSALDTAGAAALGYGDPPGQPVLRTALAGYLTRARGVRTTAERVVVCAGYGHGLGLLAGVLHDQGARAVGVEAWGHDRHRQTLTAAGLDVVPLDVDEAGAVPDGLDRLDAVVLTPAHQFPLGVALAPERRAAFAEWARRMGGLLVEDDYDGEFRYDRKPVGALQALAPEHTAYAGTASKTLAPGVRLGWLALPQALVAPVTDRLQLGSAHPGTLDQLALAALIVSGAYDRHVRRSRSAYRHRRDRLLAALAPINLTLRGLPAGMHLLVDLPTGRTELEMVDRAAALGLAVGHLDEFAAVPGRRPPTLVVGYGTPTASAYAGALARLVDALGRRPRTVRA